MARMRAYFKLDLYFFEHPKVVDLSHAAMVLYIASIAYANRRETDGFIARPVLRRLIEVDEQEGRSVHEVAKELAQAGLWEEVEGGWEVHDFLDHNESSDERDERRAGERDRKRRARAEAKGGPDGPEPPSGGPSGIVPPDKNRRPSGQERPSGPVRGIAVTEHSDSRTEENIVVVSDADVLAIRPDVDRLCNLLADAIQHNTGKRPPVGKRWYDACRMLLDTDDYTAEQVEQMIRWAQTDEFWRTNILSMSKLREKRLTIIGQMQRTRTRQQQQRDQLIETDEYMQRWANERTGKRGDNGGQTRVGSADSAPQPQLPRPGTTT